MKKRFKGLAAAFCLAAAPFSASSAAQAAPPRATIILNMDTNEVVSQSESCARSLRRSNGECTVYLASLTKLVTAAVVAQEIERGNVSLDEDIVITRRAANMPADAVRMGFAAGTRVRLRDAMAVMAKYSANDFAVAIAEHVGGSERRFVDMMNEYVRNLGFEHTHLGNPSGMPEPNFGGASRSTPLEMARLVAIISENDIIRQFFDERVYRYRNEDFGPRRVVCYNNLEPVVVKTGYTNMSGSNIAYVHEATNGHQYSIVLFGYQSSFARNKRLVEIIDDLSPDQAQRRSRLRPGC